MIWEMGQVNDLCVGYPVGLTSLLSMDERKINFAWGKSGSPKEEIVDRLLRDSEPLVSILELRLLDCKDH